MSINDLSNTEKGKLWLSQFEKSDSEKAKMILNDLIYVSHNEFVKSLSQLIRNFAKKHDSETIALFAARENMGDPFYWSNNKKPPRSVHGISSVGSEGIIAHLCRDIAKENTRIQNHPSLTEMKDRKCRYIIIVDDIIASGNRIEKFSKWLYKTKTIKSWYSFGYIKFIACSYFASIYGENKLMRNKLIDEVLKVQSNGNGRSIWSASEKKEIQNLCIKYSKFTSRSEWPLGFKEAFTTILLPHKCPNTNPAILWANKKNSWNAIFSLRPALVLNNEPILNNNYFQEKILRVLRHTDLTKPSFFKKLNSESRQLLVLLSCIASQRRDENVLSNMLALPIPTIRQKFELCKKNGWIDEEQRITKDGLGLLTSARRNACISSKQIIFSNEFYYPKTFRGSTSSSSLGLLKGDSHEL